MVGNGKKILTTTVNTLREFVMNIAMDLCTTQILTAFIWKSVPEKTLCILTRKATVIYVVPVIIRYARYNF